MVNSLHEKKILITREETQAKEFAAKVLQHGGKPVEIPLLKISCKDQVENWRLLQNLMNYQWIFFTSANGVECFFRLAKKYHIDIKSIQANNLAVVGHKTEDALKRFGCNASFIPSIYNADVMASEFLNSYKEIGPILLVRGNRSRDVLPSQFSDHGLLFDLLEVYETSYNYQMEERLNDLLIKNAIDYITFTSPSTVEAYCEMTTIKNKHQCVCIGTTTENRARELGFHSILTPEEFTIDGMIDCIRSNIDEKG